MFRIRLKELRDNRGISQYKLADILGISQARIGHWEAGTRECDFNMLIKLADYFGVTIDYLLGHDIKSQNIEHINNIIANEFFHKNTALLSDKNFVDLAKLYNVMTQDYKTRILTYTLGIAIGLGLDTNKLLNTWHIS